MDLRLYFCFTKYKTGPRDFDTENTMCFAYLSKRFDVDEAKEYARETKSIRSRLHRFATHTSLQGIPFVNRARRWYSKLFWSLVFATAMAVMMQQTYLICEKYYRYETTTSVKIGYDKLQFPSVSLCNINPVRLSGVGDVGGELEQFVNAISPQTEYDQEVTAPTEEETAYLRWWLAGAVGEPPATTGAGTTGKRRKVRLLSKVNSVVER